MARRDFIKLTAITGTSATLASCGNPEHQLIRFVPDEDLVPGVAEWTPSVCPAWAGGRPEGSARPGRPVRARAGVVSDHVSPRSAHAADEAERRSRSGRLQAGHV